MQHTTQKEEEGKILETFSIVVLFVCSHYRYSLETILEVSIMKKSRKKHLQINSSLTVSYHNNNKNDVIRFLFILILKLIFFSFIKLLSRNFACEFEYKSSKTWTLIYSRVRWR